MSGHGDVVPEGYQTITPYLCVEDARKAMAFYAAAFGAVERVCVKDMEGRVRHAEMQLGSSRLFLTDVPISLDMRMPGPDCTSPVWLYLFVEDPDAVFQRAVSAGAEVVTPVGDQVWGDRYGAVTDPFGYRWGIAKRNETLTPEALVARMTDVYRRD